MLSDTYMFRLFNANPLPEPIRTHCQLDPSKKWGEISIEIAKFSFKKMDLKNAVSKMSAILHQPQCVNAM